MSLPSPAVLKTIVKVGGGFFSGMFFSSVFSSNDTTDDTEPAQPAQPAQPTQISSQEVNVSAVLRENNLKIVSDTAPQEVNVSAALRENGLTIVSSNNTVDMEAAWRKVVGIKTAQTADYSSNGKTAQRIASVTPYFPFKGVPRFYDIGGFLKDPEAFQLAIDVFVDRYRGKEIDAIAGFDARGFILGPPIALALKKPFIMLRKKGKMPNAITGKEYSKEYAGNDSLSIPRGSISKGDKVLLIDDLVATGGTLVAGIDLVKGMGGEVVEAACVVELKFLNARKKFEESNHGDVPIWALMDEEILTLDGLKDASINSEGYVDDGEAH